MNIHDRRSSRNGAINLSWRVTIPDHWNRRIVILLHGFSSSKNNKTNVHVSPHLIDKKYGIFALDFMGCGDSTGDVGETTITSGTRDLSVTLDDYEREFGEPDGYDLIGSSFGAAVGLAARNMRDIRRFSLKSPMLDIQHAQLVSRGVEAIDEWRVSGKLELPGKSGTIELKYDYFSDAANYNFLSEGVLPDSPVKIVHGTSDEIAPFDDSVKFVSVLPRRRKLTPIEGADHKYTSQSDFERMKVALVSGILDGSP